MTDYEIALAHGLMPFKCDVGRLVEILGGCVRMASIVGSSTDSLYTSSLLDFDSPRLRSPAMPLVKRYVVFPTGSSIDPETYGLYSDVQYLNVIELLRLIDRLHFDDQISPEPLGLARLSNRPSLVDRMSK